ncbi:MAG: hypothetical protein Aurels2KO_33940 [Aureliella sp.]
MNVIVLRRRLVYISCIVLLLVPLYFLGRPSVRDEDGSTLQAGGVLSQIRDEYDLGQGDLGQIDPASESMRLATLGLRGVAATILWQKAEYYKKEQFWDRLSATLQQIAVLQPHFVKVWDFQSHNMSYNVSSEFDDYRQRYQWVKRGMNYLIKGAKYNKSRTEMPFQLGWFFGSKLGVADEKKQFREMYREDSVYHAEVLESSGLDLTVGKGLGPDRRPDNWLSGVLWYDRAEDMVLREQARPCKSTMMFYRQGPQWLMKYSDGLQDEGILDIAAKVAWGRAGNAWGEFGDILIKTTFGDEIRLRELDRANSDYNRLLEQFKEFAGETYIAAFERSYADLTQEERDAWETLDIDRNFDEVLLAETVGYKLSIPPQAVARELPDDKRVEGLKLAEELAAARDKINHIEIYRNQINYSYWEARCEAEQEQEAVDARTSMFDANQSLDQGELDAAIENYEIAWVNWRDLFNKHPAMMIDDSADEVLTSIEEYRRLLDTDLPEDFELAQFMKFRELYESSLADPAMMSVIAQWPERFPGRDFLTEMLRKSAVMDLMDFPTLNVEGKPVDGLPPVPGDLPPSAAEEPASGGTSSEEAASDEPEEKSAAEDSTVSVGQPSDSPAPEPKPDEPKSDEPTSDESTSGEPVADEPADADPKSDDAPAADEPKAEEAKPEESPAGSSSLPVSAPESGNAPVPPKK